MSLLDKLRGLFTRSEIPDETRRIFESARSADELLRGLDNLLTRNEVEFKELDQEISKLEQLEQLEVERIRLGHSSGRQKRNALLHIKRLRKQMDNYEKRLKIYDRNMNLHLNLISKIQDIEAMKLRGVDETRIDSIIMSFEENLEKYNETMNAAAVMEQSTVTAMTPQEERELRDLEAEILGEEAARERQRVRDDERSRQQVERPARDAEPRATERPAQRAADIERLVDRELEGDGAGPATGETGAVPSDEELDELERQLLEE